MNQRIVTIGIVVLTLFIAACRPDSSSQQRYELKGKVVSVDKNKQTVTIAHEEVKDFMESMTMPFNIRDVWVFEVLAPGDQISATLVVDGTESWLEDLVVSRVTDPTGSPAKSQAAPGDDVPDFTLVNQDSKPISIAQYRGKALLITFIYTRCPIPDYCTLMSTNFAEINRELEKHPELYNRIRLLSISIEPEYDRPAVLRSYGASHTGRYEDEKFTHWEFATGSKEQVKAVAEFFGLHYYPEKDQIIHGLRTVIIAPDGKVAKVYEGNEWKPAKVLKDLGSVLG